MKMFQNTWAEEALSHSFVSIYCLRKTMTMNKLTEMEIEFEETDGPQQWLPVI